MDNVPALVERQRRFVSQPGGYDLLQVGKIVLKPALVPGSIALGNQAALRIVLHAGGANPACIGDGLQAMRGLSYIGEGSGIPFLVGETEEVSNTENKKAPPKRKRSNRRNQKKGLETTVTKKDKEIGIYICRTKFSENEDKPDTWAEKDYEGDKVEVTPLSKEVLEKYLK